MIGCKHLKVNLFFFRFDLNSMYTVVFGRFPRPKKYIFWPKKWIFGTFSHVARYTLSARIWNHFMTPIDCWNSYNPLKCRYLLPSSSSRLCHLLTQQGDMEGCTLSINFYHSAHCLHPDQQRYYKFPQAAKINPIFFFIYINLGFQQNVVRCLFSKHWSKFITFHNFLV